MIYHATICHATLYRATCYRTACYRATSYASKLSSSESQSELEASDGMRRSPRGDNETEPTFGPSGIAERLNCCEKNLR